MTTNNTTSAVDIYIQSTLRLVRSLVIKSEISAQRLNADIISKHGVDSVDTDYPETWKYYMNISGQYHFTDTPMKVISLDTQGEIDFTRENMIIHTATAKAYKYGTRFYYALVNRYPDQEQLILAITNPVDINRAITAEDGTILTYYKELVEYQENTLIYDLESYIKGFLSRYTVIGFNNIWRNEPVLTLADLYGSLPAKIMNLRLLACKTSRAHSFHIEQYLASHGRLDRFIRYMTLKQKLYLYHNIDYIEKFAGHTAVFEELIQWILTDRRIPLSSYTMRQLQAHGSNLLPIVTAHRTQLGTTSNAVEAEYVDLATFYEKEKETKQGNPSYYDYNEATITHGLQTSPSSVIQTKDLESAMVDYTDAVPDTLPEILLKQWAYMSAKGFYNVLVNFNHPISGERYSILAKDALIYYSYVMMCMLQHRPDEVPTFLNVKYRLHPRPDVSLLYKDLLPNRFPSLKDIADNLIQPQPVITECFSTTAFFNLSYEIYQEAQKHWFLKSSSHDPLKRGIIAKMIGRLYGIEDLVLYDGEMNMLEWLSDKSLPVFDGTYMDGLKICDIIFEQATGYAVDDSKTLRSIQKAMIEMFSQLSSYSIQVMRDINESSIIPLNWAAIRTGMLDQELNDSARVFIPVRVQDVEESSKNNISVNTDDSFVDAIILPIPQEVSVKAPVNVEVVNGPKGYELSNNVNVSVVRVYCDSDNPRDHSGQFLPMTYYDALSQEELQEIANSITSRK